MDIHSQRILIIDFGSQYTQLIARRVRECGIYCEIHPYTITDQEVIAFNPAGVILSGGPETVTTELTPRAPQSIFSQGYPVLGICYGMQTMALQLGGRVAPGENREFGYAKVKVLPGPLLHELADHITPEGDALLDVWMSHGDYVSELPQGFQVLASTDHCAIVAMANAERSLFGLQFHPEVSHTRQGLRILSRFLFDICQVKPSWTAHNIIEDQIEKIRDSVQKDGVLLGLSGGVDSSVAALLLQKAIGDQLTCVFVDTGLLRKDEAKQVKLLFEQHFKIKLVCVDARTIFFEALAGIQDPEEKRKIVGKTFIDVFEQEAKELANVAWLAQGTIYSDVIESAHASSGAHVIKSHHNVGGLPEKMQFKLVEPLRELFKDEVRKVGLELGLPHELVYRHPFPGPGLAIRVLGDVRPEYVEKLRSADAILIAELYKNDLYYKVSQAFAVFLPIKSVGVIGDARLYDHVVCLRIVESLDFMTAHAARLPHAFLEHVANRIINEVHGISRVTYDITSKPPATIEWE